MKVKTSKLPSIRKRIGAFSLVEILVVVTIIGLLSGLSILGVRSVQQRASNERMLDDILLIANALEDYRRDHNNQLPIPKPSFDENQKINQNVLCFYKDATYAHDCDQAEFVQGSIDNSLMGRNYLREVPTDPRTGNRYVYGVTRDGRFFQVAGVYASTTGFEARVAGNLEKGYELPSLIRAFDGPNFVTSQSAHLPYNPDHLNLSGTLQNLTGTIKVNNSDISDNGQIVQENDLIQTQNASADLYLSDGSVVTLDPQTELKLDRLQVAQNDSNGTITEVILNLNKGKVWNKVARLAKGSEFKVETTNAIAGVRGTEFGMDAGTQKAELLSGSINLSNKGNQTVQLDKINANKDAATFNGGSITTAALTNASNLITQYYGKIPLSNMNEPHLISVDGSKGQVVIRNIQFYVNEVNLKTKRTGRTVDANRLAVYDENDQFIQAIDITGNLQKNYELNGLPTTGKKLLFRFEKCRNNNMTQACPTNELESQSSTNRAVVELNPNTKLTEKALYPNLVALHENKPKLVIDPLNAVNIVDRTFNVTGLVSNYTDALTNIKITSKDTAICTAGNTSSNQAKWQAGVHLVKEGICSVEISMELKDGTILSGVQNVQVIAANQKLFLKRPGNTAEISRAGERISLVWDAPGAKLPEYKVMVEKDDGKGGWISTDPTTQKPFVDASKITKTDKMTEKLSVGKYRWKVELFENQSTTPTETSNYFAFEMKPNLAGNVQFEIFEGSNLVSQLSDASLKLYLQNNTQYKTLNIKLGSNVPTGNQYSYDWKGSGIAVDDQKLTFDLDAKTLANLGPSNPLTFKVQLTVREQPKPGNALGALVGTATKTVTVYEMKPILAIAFENSPVSLTAFGTPVNLPKLRINGDPQLTFEAKDCTTISANVGTYNQANNTYDATSGSTGPAQVKCELKEGTIILKHRVYGGNLVTTTANSLVVNLPGSSQPNLATICNAGSNTWFDSSSNSCWALGKAGDSCDTACGAVQSGGKSLKCVQTSGGLGNWNADARVCGGLKLSLSQTTFNFDYAPLAQSQGCFLRDASKTKDQKCSSVANVFGQNYPRICKCDL